MSHAEAIATIEAVGDLIAACVCTDTFADEATTVLTPFLVGLTE